MKTLLENFIRLIERYEERNKEKINEDNNMEKFLPTLTIWDGYYYITIEESDFMVRGDYAKDKASAKRDLVKLLEATKNDGFIGTSWVAIDSKSERTVVSRVDKEDGKPLYHVIDKNNYPIFTSATKEVILRVIHNESTKEGVKEIQEKREEARKKHEQEQIQKDKTDKIIKDREELEYNEFLNFPHWNEAFKELSNRDKPKVFNQFKKYRLKRFANMDIGKKEIGKSFNRKYFNRLNSFEQQEYEERLANQKEPHLTFNKDGKLFVVKITKTIYNLLDSTLT